MRTRDLFYTALASLLSLGVSLAQDSDVLLAQLEQRRSYRPSSGEIDRLSHAFGIYPTGMGPSEAYALRMRRAARASAYFNLLRNGGISDPLFGLALAGAYRNLGGLQSYGGDPRFIDSRGALLSYQNSYLLLSQLANRYPDDPRFRGELVGIATQIRALGGTIPVWFSMPVGGPRETDATTAGIPASALQPVKQAAPELPIPQVDLTKAPDSQRKACEEGLDLYLSVASTAQGAFSVMNSLRQSVQSRGLDLRADYTTLATHIVERMRTASGQLTAFRCTEATESVRIAEAQTHRLLKELGQP